MSDTSASESDVSKSGDVSGTENERRRKIDTMGDKKGEKTTEADDFSTSKSTKHGNSESESKMCEDQQRKRKADEKTDCYISSPKKLQKITSSGQSEETSKGTPTKKKEKRKRKKKHKEKGLPELRVIPK